MALSAKAKKLITEFKKNEPKRSDLKKHGKEIKKDHDLALELWSTGDLNPRLLATLIFDKKLLTEDVVEGLAADLMKQDETERNHVSEWLLANQLTKDKKLVALMETWEENPSPVLRRLYWYHQARLRWMGKIQPNSKELLESAEAKLADEEPEVQWAMNFCCGWIGVYESKLRARCIKLGKKVGLYKDEVVPKNCTPGYLPEFIKIEVDKRK